MWIFDLFKPKKVDLNTQIEDQKNVLKNAYCTLSINERMLANASRAVENSKNDIQTLTNRILNSSSEEESEKLTMRVLEEEDELKNYKSVFLNLKLAYEETEEKIRSESNKLRMLESMVNAKQLQIKTSKINFEDIDTTELDCAASTAKSVSDFNKTLGQSDIDAELKKQLIREKLDEIRSSSQ